MHLLILGMNYAPEPTGIGPYTSGLAEHLVRRGHRVTVATAFPHYPQWRFDPAYAHGRRGLLWEQRQGVTLHRGWVALPRDRGTTQRIRYDSSLAFSALLNALPVTSVDLVLCITPPLQLAVSAALLRARHHAPVILLVKDLVPAAALALGMLRSGPALRLAQALERYAYRHADGIIVIGEAFRRRLTAQGVPPDRITVIPDWVDTEQFPPLPRENAFRQRQQIAAEQLLVLHAGNMGAKQGLRTLIEAAALLGDAQDIQVLLVGDGNERANLERLARVRRLRNVTFLPLQPAADVPEMLAAADLLVLLQRRGVTDSVVPSKLLTYLAAARPILAATEAGGATAELLAASGAGVIVPPEDPPALAAGLRAWRANLPAYAALGRNGRRYAEAHYARKRVLERYEEYLVTAAGG